MPFDPHIKKIAWTIFLIAGTILLYIYLGPVSRKALPARNSIATDAVVLPCKILEYGFNRIGDIDKLMVIYNDQKTWLHFPPHTAARVMNTAPKNSSVQASFHITDRKAADGKPMHDLLSIANPSVSFEIASIRPPTPASGKSIELKDTIQSYKQDEKGDTAGFVMGRFIIEIPKHVSVNIVPMLRTAKEIIVKGYERNPADGFVNTTGFILVKPFGISIDKTYYLL